MIRRRENQKVRDQNQKVRDQRRHHNQQQSYRLDHHNNQHNRQLMKCLPHHLRNHRQNHLRLHPRRIFVVHVKIVLRSVSKTMTARHAILTLQINLSRDVKRCKMEGALDSFVLLPVKVNARRTVPRDFLLLVVVDVKIVKRSVLKRMTARHAILMLQKNQTRDVERKNLLLVKN